MSTLKELLLTELERRASANRERSFLMRLGRVAKDISDKMEVRRTKNFYDRLEQEIELQGGQFWGRHGTNGTRADQRGPSCVVYSFKNWEGAN